MVSKETRNKRRAKHIASCFFVRDLLGLTFECEKSEREREATLCSFRSLWCMRSCACVCVCVLPSFLCNARRAEIRRSGISAASFLFGLRFLLLAFICSPAYKRREQPAHTRSRFTMKLSRGYFSRQASWADCKGNVKIRARARASAALCSHVEALCKNRKLCR